MLKRSVSILRSKGAIGFARAAISKIKRTLEGGSSSRPYIKPIAGLIHPLFEFYFQFQYGGGTDIMMEDWDTLVLLDACRYDDFVDANTLEGQLSHRFSKGADSPTFLEKNFENRTLHDTVYVTTNPHVTKLDDEIFHALIDDPLTEWNEQYQCVMPGSVTAAAIEAHRTYPNKRLIVHYMQPHDPPIGPIGDELREKHDIAGPDQNDDGGIRIMDAVSRGDISVKKARRAYRETLEIVLDDVEELHSKIDGKTVISADHGELFGERYPILGELYEHYDHPRTRTLCKVPWFVAEYENRRTVFSEPPLVTERADRRAVESQLKALGYSE